MKIRHTIPAAALLFGMSACTPEQIAAWEQNQAVHAEPAEDSPEWDCEQHGNKVCGKVNVEIWDNEDGRWIEVHDERGRLVFGPNLVQSERQP